MARKRRRDDILDRMIASFSFRGALLHPATLFLVATVLIIGTSIISWERYKNRILPPEQYQLTAENLQVSPQPAWTSPDVRTMILGDQRGQDYQPKSIMDTALVPAVASTLKSVGWIENIDGIQKSKHGLDVQLTYRRPVGMVEINAMTVSPAEFKGKKAVNLHIDRQGVVMAGPHSEQPGDHLLISIGNPMNMDQLLSWSQWQDVRVQGAAKISDALQDRWKALGFFRLTTFRSRANATDQRIPFQLWTEPGRKYRVHLIWGNPPGQELANEASAAEKIQAMEQYVQANGPFHQMTDRVVDVRSGSVVVLGDYNNAKNESLNNLR
jgi:hypothetical protein